MTILDAALAPPWNSFTSTVSVSITIIFAVYLVLVTVLGLRHVSNWFQ